MRRWGAVAVGVALVVGIVGCAGAPATGPGSGTPSHSAMEDPAVEPTQPVARTTGIVILPEAVRFMAGDSELRTLGYDTPFDAALADFTQAFGPETSKKEWPATNHAAPATEHGFGDVRIIEHHYDGAVETDALIHPVWSISTRGAQVGDVRVGTAGGLTVGSSVEDVAGWNDPGRLGTLTLSDHVMAELLVEAAPGYPLVPDASRGAYGVLAIADVYPGPITVLTAPSQHGGA